MGEMLDALAEADNSVLTATDEIPAERNLVLPVTQESEKMITTLAEANNSVLTATDEIPAERNLVLPVTQKNEEMITPLTEANPERSITNKIREDYIRRSTNNLRQDLYKNNFSNYENYQVDPEVITKGNKLFIKSIRK